MSLTRSPRGDDVTQGAQAPVDVLRLAQRLAGRSGLRRHRSRKETTRCILRTQFVTSRDPTINAYVDHVGRHLSWKTGFRDKPFRYRYSVGCFSLWEVSLPSRGQALLHQPQGVVCSMFYPTNGRIYAPEGGKSIDAKRAIRKQTLHTDREASQLVGEIFSTGAERDLRTPPTEYIHV